MPKLLGSDDTSFSNKPRESFDDLLNNIKSLFTPEELEEIRQAYALMKSSGNHEAELLRPIVPVRKWVNDPYYLGEDVSNIYPYWKKELVKIFESEERINQVIITGALGTGKSTMAVLIILRVIYALSCYKHIAALFNLFGVSRIAFAYLSVTKEQAQNTGFALLVEWIDSIPYFREMFKRRAGIDSMVIWPEERLLVTFGSVANHFIGMNLIGSILDEANFFSGRSKEDSDYTMNNKVASMYTQIMTRSESRFIVNGVNHSMSILVSSSTVSSSFTEERIERAKDDPHTYVMSPALWEVKPWNYKRGNFYVYVGGDNIEPFVIENLDDFNMILENKKLEQVHGLSLDNAYITMPAVVKSRIIKVPEEHRQSFQGDVVIALQDIAGYSVSAANRLFTSESSYAKSISESLYHPFSRSEITLSTTNQTVQDGFMPIKSYLYNGFSFPDKSKKRFIHIDLALTGDSAGIAMSHISGWKSIYKQDSNYEKLGDNPYGLIEDEIKIPVIQMDFMLKINPPKKPNKISLSKIRDFIVYLRNEMRVQIDLITADQFQSAQLMQELEELGFKTGYLSVDRTAEAYLTFTNLMYEERIKTYDYEPFKKELFNVVYYPSKKKVDHPATGSKDVADAVVGSVFNAVNSMDKTDITEQSLVDIFINANKSNYVNESKVIENALTNLLNILKGE
jgi:hypothetical protein